MRQIKFRAWCNTEKKFVNPTYNNTTLSDLFKLPFYDLQLFTGLKDDNGIEVYQGDILQFGSQNGSASEVKFIQRNAGFLIKDKYGNWEFLYDVLASTNAKVIGNIHENPELLCTSQSI